MAFDVLFGLGSHRRNEAPMEIELNDMSNVPRDRFSAGGGLLGRRSLSLYESDTDGGAGLTDEEGILDDSTVLARQSRSSSFRTVTSHGVAGRDRTHSETSPINLIWNAEAWIAATSNIAHVMAIHCRRYVSGPGDDIFYETLRIQPFAAGAYLRGMLLAGFSSIFFNLYNLLLWPASSHRTNGEISVVYMMETMLFIFLSIQTALNVMQLPIRVKIHWLCWESSRSVEVENSVSLLRNMIQSDYWVLNVGMGRLLDIMSVSALIGCELYRVCAPEDDPVASMFVSLCATNLLAFVVRLIVATFFGLSTHDPQVLSDARRRGLSRWDLEVLPTFVFASADEVNNHDCPICLCGFDMGEMLISLPCDKKHSFHAGCIRQWLQRQNSCPLCQRMV